ncbi:hypothetical protein GJ744_006068, partial [Endocarpon pusillum]
SNQKEQRFRRQQFPDVTEYGLLRDIITKCWYLEYGTKLWQTCWTGWMLQNVPVVDE